jgi:hypothetical protein
MKSTKPKTKTPKEGRRNAALDKYSDIVLFPEKLKKANDILKKVGIPKI